MATDYSAFTTAKLSKEIEKNAGRTSKKRKP